MTTEETPTTETQPDYGDNPDAVEPGQEPEAAPEPDEEPSHEPVSEPAEPSE
jgi:hypothetical protein